MLFCFFPYFLLRSIADVASRLGHERLLLPEGLLEAIVFFLEYLCLLIRTVYSNDVQRLGRNKKSGLARINAA